jgi:CRP-like cAMP-binding protein
MSLDDDIATLAHAPLFCLLSRDAVRLLAFAAEKRVLKAGEALFRKGDRSDGGYVVSRGTIALDGSGSIVVGPGALVGQTALFTRIERPATATAREPSSVLRISPSLVRRVIDECPGTAATLQAAVAADLTTLAQGLEGVRQRLCALDGEKQASPQAPPTSPAPP